MLGAWLPLGGLMPDCSLKRLLFGPGRIGANRPFRIAGWLR